MAEPDVPKGGFESFYKKFFETLEHLAVTGLFGLAADKSDLWPLWVVYFCCVVILSLRLSQFVKDGLLAAVWPGMSKLHLSILIIVAYWVWAAAIIWGLNAALKAIISAL